MTTGHQKTVEMQKVIREIVENDTNYDKREILIYKAMALARELKYKICIYIDEKSGPEWPVFSIELPLVGQVSWHMPTSKIKYDDHTTQEKLDRCLEFSNLKM